MSELIEIINSIGFPIFVAVWFIFKGHNDSEQIKEAILKLQAIVENNTKAIEIMHKYCEKSDK